VEIRREKEIKKRKMRRKKEKEKGNRRKYKIERYNGHFTIYTVRRSCFADHFSKTVSHSQENLLHQHSHGRSCHSVTPQVFN
jgi:ATP-dependent Clp protease adapter protein ClpS